MLQDGLGSIRAEVDASADVLTSQSYAPYGLPFNISGNFTSPFGFTGEQVDSNGLNYNRARYYNPMIGTFTALDPFEGIQNRPMSLNGYSWVEGNPINLTDAIGLYLKCTLVGTRRTTIRPKRIEYTQTIGGKVEEIEVNSIDFFC
ncbi:RHS repeat-associated core domain-containing protein [Phototrophicus methaneseepsis]|uniref:RHS repeat-associated core domain-containing protein n=1 Tax=Phototrophicus methaneseepsis TaxID=2710758 RepID=A0A7S8IEI2_9CHLR|nr:RHS repeat-associated core domain-containing protein [Phototrophicus methaneseepsis]QPC82469.1 RHS repeat-associated core domain-containing protein [Phototrophicus methaneseepsis]